MRSPVLLCVLSVFFGAACDLDVAPGQTTVLGNGGAVFGVNTPNAVVVRPGGTLTVEDADLSGRGVRREQSDFVPDVLGAAIVSDGGSVRILDGKVSGGNVLFVPDDPSTPPIPPPGGFPVVAREQFVVLPPALIAVRSSVAIEGGVFASGGRFTPDGPFGRGGVAQFVIESPAVSVRASTLSIGGGDFQIGPVNAFAFPPGTVLSALESQVEIRGGRFTGFVNLGGSQSRILGGELRLLSIGFGLSLGDPVPPAGASGCTEIHGGLFGSATIASPSETLLIFGTGFNRPFGPVPITTVSSPIVGAEVGEPSAEVTGVLADGSALDLKVFAWILPANVVLAAPGSAGCLAR